MPSGYFKVSVTDFESASGLSEVKFAVWTTAGGQDDLKWYKASITNNGAVAEYKVYFSNHWNQLGQYNIHCYATAKNGVTNCTTVNTYNFAMSYGTTSATIPDSELYVNCEQSNTRILNSYTVKFAVWSEAGGQNDLVWYTAKYQDGNYVLSAPISNHRTLGNYIIHAYLFYGNNSWFMSSTTVTYNTSFSCTYDLSGQNGTTGTYNVNIKNINSHSGVSSIKCPTWRNVSTSATAVWYGASKKSSTEWAATVNVADHDFYFGNYTTHIYITMGNGVQMTYNAGQASISPNKYFGVKYLGGSNYKMCVDGFDLTPVHAIQFPTWSSWNGQDDVVWYNGIKESNQRATCTFSIRNHWPAGEYNVHVYAYSASYPGGSTLIANKLFNVPYEALAISGNDQLDNIIKGIIRAYPTLDGCFNYVANAFAYRSGSTWPGGEWTIPFAIEMATTGSGNCYRYAALFLWCARALGYSANAICGLLPSRSGLSPHGWVEVYLNGQTYVCDPELKHVMPGYNFYMITYGSAPLTYYR